MEPSVQETGNLPCGRSGCRGSVWLARLAAVPTLIILGRAAQELRKARGDLMGAALADGGKTLPESDPEVSEAIDFLEFYRDTARWWQEMPTLQAKGKGVVVVVVVASTWNFPIAIPCGGVAAALATGNTVILKPASDTVLVAWELCQCFWRAGVSKQTLQFVPCSGSKEGKLLVNHPKVNAVILTGGTGTALSMLRETTGAVVLRQPFGGMGKSVFGPGMKAGGPNYVAQFMDFADTTPASERDVLEKQTLASLCTDPRLAEVNGSYRIRAAVASCDRSYREEFGKAHDHFALVGQDNFRRYQPVRRVRVRVRVHPDDTAFEVFARVCAAHAVGCQVIVSRSEACVSAAVTLLDELTEAWAGDIEFIEESDQHLIQAIRGGQCDRIRYATPDRAPQNVLQSAFETGACVVSVPVSAEGRRESLWYVHEQSISIDYHRYGNLGIRASESRANVL